MKSIRLSTPRGPISLVVQGKGPALILIAGLGASSRLWGDFPSILARNFTVITPDNRGIGGSREGEDFSLQGAASDLVACLDALDLDRTSLLGASMGGIIAQRCALDFPDRIRSMVIASAAARLSEHGRRIMKVFLHLLEELPPKEFGRVLMSLAFAPPFQNRYPAFVSQAAELYGLAAEDLPGARAQARHLLKGWDYHLELAQLLVPALILSGARDPVVCWEDSAELAAFLPNADFEKVEDAGHSVLAEGGEYILNKVRNFLISRAPRPSTFPQGAAGQWT